MCDIHVVHFKKDVKKCGWESSLGWIVAVSPLELFVGLFQGQKWHTLKSQASVHSSLPEEDLKCSSSPHPASGHSS